MFKKHLSFKFGQVSVEEIFKAIFVLGLLPLIGYGFIGVFAVNSGLVGILNASSSSGRIFDPGLLFSGFVTFFFLLVAIVVWKLVCELLYLVFRSLEVYIRRNE
ncbi:MAG: hypothetical protein N2484_01670 [Clostridia bacterium]|nr:hypothetical protein [Clostridia bacterium]